MSIDCSDGELEDLRALSSFPRLTSLVADANNISSVDDLPHLPKLQVCSLYPLSEAHVVNVARRHYRCRQSAV